jgi:pimeloyl-ACP methyl ester carboxylesterase
MGSADYLDIDGRLGFVETYGTGQPVLCVHTAGQHGFQYRYAARAIAERGFRAIVVDLPGHGRSEPAVETPVSDLSWYGDWCIKVLRELAVECPYLLGCSIGGKIVLDMAAKIPAELAGVVSMAAYGQRRNRPGRSERPWGLEDSSSPSNRERSFYGHAGLVGRSVPPEVTQMIAEMHSREDWQITVPDQTGWARQDIWADLPKITCPTYLVVGEDDFGVPVARVQATAARIPGARVAQLPGIGHYPMEELPDFADYFVRWIGELDADAGR